MQRVRVIGVTFSADKRFVRGATNRAGSAVFFAGLRPTRQRCVHADSDGPQKLCDRTREFSAHRVSNRRTVRCGTDTRFSTRLSAASCRRFFRLSTLRSTRTQAVMRVAVARVERRGACVTSRRRARFTHGACASQSRCACTRSRALRRAAPENFFRRVNARVTPAFRSMLAMGARIIGFEMRGSRI